VEVFPVFLKLAGRQVLVVGGGPVAAAKIEPLRAAGAHLTVVAPDVCDAISALTGADLVIRRRDVTARDLDDAWFVVAAATPAANRFVAEEAAKRRIFVNAVDDPANASAYLGGVLRRDGVTVAISTNGRAPALAGLLREAFEVLIPADLSAWLERADMLKRHWRSARVPMQERRPQLAAAILHLYQDRLKRRDLASAS
jgi:uroporphyrin-III C-methyltransferase/precorrin-2 dehydrogenase/sirohydrochlorin ferrochelatase